MSRVKKAFKKEMEILKVEMNVLFNDKMDKKDEEIEVLKKELNNCLES